MLFALLPSNVLQTASITVDARSSTPISRYIYGVNNINGWTPAWQASWKGRGVFTLARQGGNRMTAYNWETNASNAGSDYFNENDGYLGETDEIGWTVSEFLREAQGGGAAAIVTVPTQGYVSADKIAIMNGSRDVGDTPDYLNVRFHRSYASKAGGKIELKPSLTDHAVYQNQFVAWVQRAKSLQTPVWFSLDNEPDLWHYTHSRIELTPTTYARIIANNAEFAKAIKRVDPEALVFGPVNYGWAGMMSFQDAPDANGRNFIDTYLDAMKAAETSAGKRLIDAYDFHWYPEARGGGVRITGGPAVDPPGTAEARIQAPRSMWDPGYVEDSWIAQSLGNRPIQLLPMMKGKVAAHYPGTKLAITEYDFGGRTTVSGMIAQADTLGIFGRQGLFAATHWGLNPGESAAYAGFRAFTDFDRNGSKFGDLGLGVSGEAPAQNSVYAALDSKNPKRLTFVVVNKTSASQTMHLALTAFTAGTAKGFVVREGVYEPVALTVTPASGGVNLTAPALSVVSGEVLAP